MINAGHLILAQSVNSMADLKTAVGKGLGIIVIIAYIYAVVMIIMSLIQERGDGHDTLINAGSYTVAAS